MSNYLTEEQIERALEHVAIPRHWHPEPIKRRGNTRYYIEVREIDEIVGAVMANVRHDLALALAGIFRDECPECARTWGDHDHSDCDL